MALDGRRRTPATVAEALARFDRLVGAAEIRVRPAGKYFDVVAVRPKRRETVAA